MTMHGISTPHTVGGCPFSPSNTGNPGLDAALDRIGRHIYGEPESVVAEKLAKAERVARNNADYERALAERAGEKHKPHPSAVFRKKFDDAMVECAGMDRTEASRRVAKAIAHHLTADVDGRAIDRLAGFLRQYGSALCRSVGAEFAADYAQDRKRFHNPLSVLDSRLRRAQKGVAA